MKEEQLEATEARSRDERPVATLQILHTRRSWRFSLPSPALSFDRGLPTIVPRYYRVSSSSRQNTQQLSNSAWTSRSSPSFSASSPTTLRLGPRGPRHPLFPPPPSTP